MSTTEWLEKMTARSGMRVEPVPFDTCAGWGLVDGRIAHETGGFFSVGLVRLRSSDPARDGRLFTMMDQPEVGWLGCVIRSGEEGQWEWLVQAKTEPGTAPGAQIAPTIQATRSNYRRLHGGRPTSYLDVFRAPHLVVSDSAQSEQGDRFLWKFNRNTVLVGDETVVPIDDRWRWMSSALVREALGCSMTVNTDARSVIASAPWHHLASGGPLFVSQAMQRSYARESHRLDALKSMLSRSAGRVRTRWSFESIANHDRWLRDRAGIAATPADNGVGFFHTTASDREVNEWSQPLLTRAEGQSATLVLATGGGVARVFIRPTREVGFGNDVEFGPSAGPDQPSMLQLPSLDLVDLAAVDQHDEGGRFMQSACRYRVSLLADGDGAGALDADGVWVTLATLEKVVCSSAMATSELRTLASLLLSSSCDSAVSEAAG